MAKFEWEGIESNAFYLHDIGHFKDIDEYKNKMLENISHNLRTPLTTHSGNLEITYEFEENKKKLHLIKISKIATFFLLHAVNDLLDYSQIRIEKFSCIKK